MLERIKKSVYIEIEEIIKTLPRNSKKLDLHIAFSSGGALIYSINSKIDYNKFYYYSNRYIFKIDLENDNISILNKIKKELKI